MMGFGSRKLNLDPFVDGVFLFRSKMGQSKINNSETLGLKGSELN